MLRLSIYAAYCDLYHVKINTCLRFLFDISLTENFHHCVQEKPLAIVCSIYQQDFYRGIMKNISRHCLRDPPHRTEQPPNRAPVLLAQKRPTKCYFLIGWRHGHLDKFSCFWPCCQRRVKSGTSFHLTSGHVFVALSK